MHPLIEYLCFQELTPWQKKRRRAFPYEMEFNITKLFFAWIEKRTYQFDYSSAMLLFLDLQARDIDLLYLIRKQLCRVWTDWTVLTCRNWKFELSVTANRPYYGKVSVFKNILSNWGALHFALGRTWFTKHCGD